MNRIKATCAAWALGCLLAAGAAAEETRIFDVEREFPEGNYTVTVRLGDDKSATTTWVKAEGRRLMLDGVATRSGAFATESFTVNIRTPRIDDGKGVKLNDREKGIPRWDGKLTLSFFGGHPEPASLDIRPAPDATTVFLAGDSTVTDQSREPWAAWGQILPAFFQEGVAVANHAEAGLSLDSFRYQRRLEKIFAAMKPGDYLFIQFGHNDQKERPRKEGDEVGPFTSYKTRLAEFVAQTRERGGMPVLVTPVERRRFDKNGGPHPTLADYAEAVRQVGAETGAPVIDLNAMSLELYAALGAKGSIHAFVHHPANTFPGQDKPLRDNTHHSIYGAYELARCVVEGIRAEVPELAKRLRPGLPPFDPSRPDPSVDIPPTPSKEPTEKPAGD